MNPSTSHQTIPSAPNSSIIWDDYDRQSLFQSWLKTAGSNHHLSDNTLRSASADASFRRYFRIDNSLGQSFIIMDAPPDKEDCKPFAHVADLMSQAGLLVPEVLNWDETHGFMLLTDLGAKTMMEVINPHLSDDLAEPNLDLYMLAVDTLVAWQLASKPAVLPTYDESLLRRELNLYPQWYLAKHKQITLTPTQQATLDHAFSLIVQRNLAVPNVYVHRDFMPRNLMVAMRDGKPTLGVLDFQDAVYGPITYDIASLMRDAFLSWEEPFVLDVTIRYWQKAVKVGLLGANSASGWGTDFGEFYRAVEWQALQRHLKILGIFARLTLRDGKPKYLADTPRFINYVRKTADRYRELGPFLKLIDEIEGIETATSYAFGKV
ncbi:MAG: phosphotransferase [Polaromonas sp.]|jgi:aminoglycoside/choline kinase family phosphotransferase|nr:phosphotransferase [Polaromonas sp.]